MTNNITSQTRKESFNKVYETLGERQQLIIDYMEMTQLTYTASELAGELFAENLVPTPERNAVHPRLNELVKKGVLEVIGKKKDENTGRKVAIYKLV